VDDQHNHYAIGSSRSADSGVVGSRDGAHGNDNDNDGAGTGVGCHIVLTSSGVGGNDYFHTLDCASRIGQVPGGPYGHPHFMAPYQQQINYEQTCGLPPCMASSLLRPTQLPFDDDSAVGLGSTSMITEHIYESPKLDARADNFPVTSLAADKYPEVTTVYGAVIEQSNKTGR